MKNNTKTEQERDARYEKYIRDKAAAWKAWLAGMPMGTEVTFLGNQAWVLSTHSYPEDAPIHAMSPCESGSITLVWRHNGTVQTYEFLSLEQAKALIK